MPIIFERNLAFAVLLCGLSTLPMPAHAETNPVVSKNNLSPGILLVADGSKVTGANSSSNSEPDSIKEQPSAFQRFMDELKARFTTNRKMDDKDHVAEKTDATKVQPANSSSTSNKKAADVVDAKAKRLKENGLKKLAKNHKSFSVKTVPEPASQISAEAVMNAPPERQEALSGAMIDEMAAKAKNNPNDVEGWRQLAFSYRVFGENEKAEAAESKVAQLEAQNKSSDNIDH